MYCLPMLELSHRWYLARSNFPSVWNSGTFVSSCGGLLLDRLRDLLGVGADVAALELRAHDLFLDQVLPHLIPDFLDIVGGKRGTALPLASVDGLLQDRLVGVDRDRDAVDHPDCGAGAASDLAPIHAGDDEDEHEHREHQRGDLATNTAEELHHTAVTCSSRRRQPEKEGKSTPEHPESQASGPPPRVDSPAAAC